jgi:hypothetical protein
MCWAYLADSENAVGVGPWQPATPRIMQELKSAAEYGNRHHGAGSHWIELEPKRSEKEQSK